MDEQATTEAADRKAAIGSSTGDAAMDKEADCSTVARETSMPHIRRMLRPTKKRTT